MPQPHSPFGTRQTFTAAGGSLDYYSLPKLADAGLCDLDSIPFSVRVLLESLLRNVDGFVVTEDDVAALGKYDAQNVNRTELPFKPGRVVLQDFTGVPAVVDLAALRSAMVRMGGDPAKINPLVPCDLVVDHSVQVDAFATRFALETNVEREFERNLERYELLHWAQKAFDNFRVVPPATGIVHQVNLEYLADVVLTKDGVAFPDSLVGTDSHTTMINGLGVVGWGVGGIEAEAVMLGQPIYMLTPEVVGFELTGTLPEGATATDLVLTVVQMLRAHGVVGKFVEFHGSALPTMSLADRATIANMAPEYGATMGFFPVDGETLNYLRRTGRPEALVDRVERYTKENGLFLGSNAPTPTYSSNLRLDIGTVVPCLAGPKRPQDRIPLTEMKSTWATALKETFSKDSTTIEHNPVGGWTEEGGQPAGQVGNHPLTSAERKTVEPAAGGTLEDVAAPAGSTVREAVVDPGFDGVEVSHEDEEFPLKHGSVVIAAITSCTNTSNPSVMVGAGLLARKARQRGLTRKPWVKTSLAPGSRVVTDYLDKSGLSEDLDSLGFQTVGYGCTTCIGNSGPLPAPISEAINKHDLVAAAVLSGNRNFEGRISPDVKANYLASPPLVVAYALAGTTDIDLTAEPLGEDSDGNPVFLSDLWPDPQEIRDTIASSSSPDDYRDQYAKATEGPEEWRSIQSPDGQIYDWDEDSTYIQEPPFFVDMPETPADTSSINGARCLVKVGDSVTTDHISPAGAIKPSSPAGKYLQEHGVDVREFNSYGSRRGNDRVMTRGTFANIRLRNEMAPGTEGSVTTHLPTGEQTSIYEASRRYIEASTPLIVLAGKEYGTGSSRDWAAKGTNLLGVKAVIAESYERIHRSNLVGMGVLPLQYREGESAEALGLTGRESFDIHLEAELKPGQPVEVIARGENGEETMFTVACRIDTPVEVQYHRHGGILHYVLRQLASA
ncbi:aconitate hydratase [Alienimonas californiensis]|uniref:Aconitate hydratase A n=1 Tax=Alienimonas californiensis TaxID=2527989 RepID=A0A517PDB9_9PLAN|nr:aconitate hydratase [Alienimonas californiensis]QDT17377.1 Aconitate hydratase [Alienimonas californiensis]